MGRALLIIMAGVIVALGYVSYGTSEQGKQIISRNAGYADIIHAKNTAHTAIQMAFQEMNKDTMWGYNHGEGNPWTGTVNGKDYSLYIEYVFDSPDYWSPDTIRVVSTAPYSDDEFTSIVSLYEINSLDYVPDFLSPLTIATNNFTFSQGGSSNIVGFEQSGKSGCQDKPGVTVMNGSANTYVGNNGSDITGSPAVNTDTTVSYQPTDQLIDRLEGLASTQYISGTYKGDMGTIDNPGVFFVEDQARLTGGISDGYGILVVRSGGNMAYEDSTGAELDIAGNFTFNGLVIFENAYNLDGSGTPTISGSVLVGNTEDYSGTINIDITGNLTLEYDCEAEDHAKKAASLAVENDKYKRITTFE